MQLCAATLWSAHNYTDTVRRGETQESTREQQEGLTQRATLPGLVRVSPRLGQQLNKMWRDGGGGGGVVPLFGGFRSLDLQRL